VYSALYTRNRDSEWFDHIKRRYRGGIELNIKRKDICGMTQKKMV